MHENCGGRRRGSRCRDACWGLALALLLAADAAHAASFDLTGGGTFPTATQAPSLQATHMGLTLTLRAISKIPDASASLEGGQDGVVYIDEAGAGVRFSDGWGTKQISGDGEKSHEALELSFDQELRTDSIVITFSLFQPAPPGPGGVRDRPFIYVGTEASPTLTDTMILASIKPTADEKVFVLDFADLDLDALGLPETISMLTIAAWQGAFEIAHVQAGVIANEPAALVLLGLALAGVAAVRRRPRR